MFKYFLLPIFFTVLLNASNFRNGYSYDIYQNYKKIGIEKYSFENNSFFKINATLNIIFDSVPNKVKYYFLFRDETLKQIINLKVKTEKDVFSCCFDRKNKDKNCKFVDFPKKIYVVEPLIVASLYQLLNAKNKKINIFIPSVNKIFRASLKKDTVKKKIKNKYYELKRYLLVYNNRSFEFFKDKSNTIVFADWTSMGFTSVIKNFKITSFENILSFKRNHRIKTVNLKVGKYKVKIYKYIPLRRIKKRIFIIDGVLFPVLKNDYDDILAENIFFDKLINKFSQKGYFFIRYSFENFSKKDFKKLTLSEKYKIVKKIFLKSKAREIVSIGTGSYIVFRLLKDFGKRVRKIILLNPAYFNYLKILTNQTELEFLTVKEKKSLKKSLKKLIKTVKEKKYLVFNNRLMSSKYIKELFNEDIGNYFKYLDENTKVFIFAANYDSEINSKNSWYLYSEIKNKNVKYGEFDQLNHYFYDIPYKSFAFSYSKTLKFNREFLKFFKRALKK